MTFDKVSKGSLAAFSSIFKLYLMTKLFTVLLLSFIAFVSNAQTYKELRLSFGFNNSNLRTDVLRQSILPDGSLVSGFPISSQGVGGINVGLTGAFPISKNGIWKIRTGLNFQTLRFQSRVGGAVGNETEYRFLFDHRLNQLDLPILLSMEKSNGKFSYGGDFGVIKAIAIWGEVTPSIYKIKSDQEVSISTGQTDPSGFVGIGEKYSLYVAPSVRYAISTKIKLELQPFYRYQFGENSFAEYGNQKGPPLSQFGINFGIAKTF